MALEILLEIGIILLFVVLFLLLPALMRGKGNITIQYIVSLPIDYYSIKTLYGNIGFAYNKERDLMARYIYQYTLFKENIIQKRIKAYETIKVMVEEGMSVTESVRNINLDGLTAESVNKWFRINLPKEKIKVPNNFVPPFEEWLESVTKKLKNGFVWEEIESIEETNESDVRDVTTESENHNFLANGFLVSNCVSCQVMKNGKKVQAFVPGYNAIKLINEHDEVLIECIGGTKGRAKGDIPGIKWQVIKVNDQSLRALLSGKIEKGRR